MVWFDTSVPSPSEAFERRTSWGTADTDTIVQWIHFRAKANIGVQAGRFDSEPFRDLLT